MTPHDHDRAHAQTSTRRPGPAVEDMDQPTKRNAAALHSTYSISPLPSNMPSNPAAEKAGELIQQLLERYNSMLARASEDASEDFSQTAMKEFAIKEDAMAIVRSARKRTQARPFMIPPRAFAAGRCIAHPHPCPAHSTPYTYKMVANWHLAD